MISVNGLRVKQARELKKLTQTQLAKNVGIAQSTIAKMEVNVREWPNEIVEAIAFQTGFPVSFFNKVSGLNSQWAHYCFVAALHWQGVRRRTYDSFPCLNLRSQKNSRPRSSPFPLTYRVSMAKMPRLPHV